LFFVCTAYENIGGFTSQTQEKEFTEKKRKMATGNPPKGKHKTIRRNGVVNSNFEG